MKRKTPIIAKKESTETIGRFQKELIINLTGKTLLITTKFKYEYFMRERDF